MKHKNKAIKHIYKVKLREV